MRSALGGTAAAAFALGAALGCGSTDVGAGGDGVSFDAEPPVSARDAPDGDGRDAGDAGDAGDARKDVLTPPSGYCAGLVPKPRFCDDFDDGDLKNNWDQATAVAPTLIDLDDAVFASAPLSFYVLTQKVPVGSIGNASLRKSVFGNVSRVNLGFSAHFTTSTITKGLVAIATLDVSLSHFFTLYLRDGDPVAPAAILEEQVNGTLTRHLLTRLPPAGTWARIVIDLDLTVGRANVSFGGQKALDAEPITPLVGTEATVRVGAVYLYGAADPFEAHFDDVVVDF